MDAPSPPPAPDPVATAAAQTQSNKDTAIANANLNRFDQYSPQGSVKYNVVGTNPDGTPKYEQTTSYSPGEQGIYDTNLATRQNIGQIGQEQSARIGELLGTPVNLNNDAVEGRLFDLGRARLDPMLDQERTKLEQRLANQGIGIGTEAYDRAMGLQGQRANDAYNSLLLGGRKQAVTEALTERNQPINEISALMSGSQVSQPQFTGFQPVAQANTDVAGITNAAYQNSLKAYQLDQQNDNAMMGGLFGLAGAGLRMMPWSDARLKKDIIRTGNEGPKGLKEVEWTYIWGGPRYRGYIAQEVLPLFPEAVHFDPSGFMALDYAEIA